MSLPWMAAWVSSPSILRQHIDKKSTLISFSDKVSPKDTVDKALKTLEEV